MVRNDDGDSDARLHRRTLLRRGIAVGAAATLAGCSSGGSSDGSDDESGDDADDGGPDGPPGDEAETTTTSGPEQGKIIAQVESRKVNQRGFETLTLTYEKIELEREDGETLSLDIGKEVDMTSEEVDLSASFLVTCIEAGTYTKVTHHLSVKEAVHGNDGEVSFGDIGPFTMEPTAEKSDEVGVGVNSERRVSFIVHLEPYRSDGSWAFNPYLSRQVIGNPAYCGR